MARLEPTSLAPVASEWFQGLTAPHKELITYEQAGHSVVFERVDAFHQLMTETIVQATTATEESLT